MMKIVRWVFFLMLLPCAVLAQDVVVANTESLPLQTEDSIKSVQAAAETVDLLVKEQILRYKDSLEQASLRLQIEQTTQTAKRLALEKELNARLMEDSLRREKIRRQIEQSKNNAIGYPIVIARDTIRILYTSFGSFSAAERAELSKSKIEKIAQQFIPTIDTLTLVRNEQSIEIAFKDQTLTTVTQADALWENSDTYVMASRIADQMQITIVKYRKMTSFLTILKQIGLTVLVIAVCVFLIRLINRSFRLKVRRFILSKEGKWFKGWKLRDYELLDSRQQIRVILSLVNVLRWAIIIFIFYISLPILFSIFPITQRLADMLFGWVWMPFKRILSAIIDYLPNLFVILVIWFIMRYVIKGVKYLMNEIEEGRIRIKGFYSDWAPATYSILRFLLYAFTFVLIFNYLPYSDSKIFQGVSVFVGLILSLGSTSAIGNIIAGMIITYMRPFKIGDHIRIGDITGDVLEKTPFVVRIRTNKQEIVTLPNSNVLSGSVVNYSTSAVESDGVIFYVTISIGYDVPWRKVHELMIEAANRSQYVLKEPNPYVLQTSLDDFYVSYQLCTYSKNPEKQAEIYSQLHQNIQDVFNENGIEIMSPHYRAERDGNATTIPENYRSQGYTPPPFIFKQEK